MGVARGAGQQAFSESRLAEAGLGREQPDPTLAKLGLIPTAQQQLDLLLSANERRQPARAPRLEAADAGRLAAHLPSFHRVQQALHLDSSYRAAVEHPPDQPMRARRNDDLTRRCSLLQPRPQV